MSRVTFFLTLLIIHCCLSINCSSDNKASSESNGTLEMEVQMDYQTNKLQPVVQTSFYLINTDKETAEKETSETEDARMRLNVLLTLSAGAKQGKMGIKQEKCVGFFLSTKPAWEASIVQSVETDASGKAIFTNLKNGNYIIKGATDMQGGCTIWDAKISVEKGNNKILLNQKNALYSSDN